MALPHPETPPCFVKIIHRKNDNFPRTNRRRRAFRAALMAAKKRRSVCSVSPLWCNGAPVAVQWRPRCSSMRLPLLINEAPVAHQQGLHSITTSPPLRSLSRGVGRKCLSLSILQKTPLFKNSGPTFVLLTFEQISGGRL